MVPGSLRAQKAANNSKLYIFMCALRFFLFVPLSYTEYLLYLMTHVLPPKAPRNVH